MCPDIYAAPAYEPEQYADRIYPPLTRAVTLLTRGMVELHNAIDRCPGGDAIALLQLVDERLAHDVMPLMNDTVDLVSGGTP